jgi:hypothetical protein
MEEHGIILSKLHTYSELLENMDIPSDLLEDEEGQSYLWLYFDSFEAVLTCRDLDEDDSFSHFMIELKTMIPTEGLEQSQALITCELFNASSVSGTAFLSEDGNIICLQTQLLEVLLPIPDEDLRTAVRLFENDHDLLEPLLQKMKEA